MIFSLIGQAVIALAGPLPQMAVSASSPADAVATCQAQRAAVGGMTGHVLIGSDGSFLVSCLAPQSGSPSVGPTVQQSAEFMRCRSRWNTEPQGQKPFCVLTTQKPPSNASN